jgi:hypothetical protein
LADGADIHSLRVRVGRLIFDDPPTQHLEESFVFKPVAVDGPACPI